ncbi:non-muscle caldesmon-like [Xenopus laevis]|uniref:Uncharacterized protein n=2 Tax=Xenopus laevis TaxID=8355 RepID=A0A974BW54_XENLA|nr:non-muscle caldesmon-like [Xenopus laevis]OCT61912.1 hypothetical protein XELAEV_18047945mg [Xenopus laevis]
MEYNQLQDYVLEFSLDNCPQGNQGYNRVLLQLFGFTGHGKSALINSLLYVLHAGKYKIHAESGMTPSGGAVTMERRAYELTPTITVVDNRGLVRMTDYEMRMIYAQLGNFVPLNKKVEWRGNYEEFMSQLEDSELDPNYTDFIVPVFIYKVLNTLSEQEKSQMKVFFKNCRDLTGVFPIVVVTYKTSGNYFEVENMFKCLGAEVVVAVENYSEEDQTQTQGRNTDFLSLLKYALDDVRFRMVHPRNPKEERIQRKKFLHMYSHNTYMEEKSKKERFMARKRMEDRKRFFARKREEAIRKREARRREEESREREEARRRTEEAKRRAEEARAIEEARRRAEEAMRREEESRRAEEAREREEARRRKQARRREAASRRAEEAREIERVRMRAEEHRRKTEGSCFIQ